ncbi:MAG: polysaccharide deacetylase family protein [Hyphomonadaceae bacterium]|nr:polysaccharide deacetylase family protein [Hyphomonadaceae bacterium]
MPLDLTLKNAHPYEPSKSLVAKIARRLVPFQERRDVRFKLDKPVVSFTFDDFPRSAIENGSDLLEKQGWNATFYVAAGLRDVFNHHGQQFAAEDLPALEARGHEIAGHSFGHIDLTYLSQTALIAEINRNKKALRAMGVNGPIDNFAYPFGAVSALLKKTLAGQFKTLRGITPATHVNKADLNGLKSAPVFSGAKLDHTMTLIEGLKSQPGWLTLFAHDIRDTPSEWGCTPEEFTAIIEAVKNTGALVLPIQSAIQHVESNRVD